jgi:hypothetical protein
MEGMKFKTFGITPWLAFSAACSYYALIKSLYALSFLAFSSSIFSPPYISSFYALIASPKRMGGFSSNFMDSYLACPKDC